MSEEIFPFGKKFKGKPISELIDPSNTEFKDYLSWAQRDKPDLYEKINTLIEKFKVNTINVYYSTTGNNDSPTPEHNKLQNMFLKEEVCLKLFDNYYGDFLVKLKEYIKLVKAHEDSKYFDISDEIFESSYFEHPIKSLMNEVIFESKFNWDVMAPYKNKLYVNFNIKKEIYDKEIENFIEEYNIKSKEKYAEYIKEKNIEIEKYYKLYQEGKENYNKLCQIEQEKCDKVFEEEKEKCNKIYQEEMEKYEKELDEYKKGCIESDIKTMTFEEYEEDLNNRVRLSLVEEEKKIKKNKINLNFNFFDHNNYYDNDYHDYKVKFKIRKDVLFNMEFKPPKQPKLNLPTKKEPLIDSIDTSYKKDYNKFTSLKNELDNYITNFKKNDEYKFKEDINKFIITRLDFYTDKAKILSKLWSDFCQPYISCKIDCGYTSGGYYGTNFYTDYYNRTKENLDRGYKYFEIDSTFYIEIKTILGDDYPCVLRKMRNQIEQTHNYNQKNGLNIRYGIILLVKSFNSVNTTRDELIKIFKQANIRVILTNELFGEENPLSILDQKEEIIKKLKEENNILKEKLLKYES